MTSDARPIQLLYGYVKNLDYPDPEARKAGFTRRAALLLPPFPRAHQASDFDADLLVHLLPGLIAGVPYDRIRFVFAEPHAPAPDSISALGTYYRSMPAAAREPFRAAELARGEKATGRLRFENHVDLGKRAPYAGHYAVTVHATALDRQRTTHELGAAASSAGVQLTEPIEALAAPRISLWQRWVDFVAYDPTEDETDA